MTKFFLNANNERLEFSEIHLKGYKKILELWNQTYSRERLNELVNYLSKPNAPRPLNWYSTAQTLSQVGLLKIKRSPVQSSCCSLDYVVTSPEKDFLRQVLAYEPKTTVLKFKKLTLLDTDKNSIEEITEEPSSKCTIM